MWYGPSRMDFPGRVGWSLLWISGNVCLWAFEDVCTCSYVTHRFGRRWIGQLILSPGNNRGCGGSKGRTSWTGRGETGDLETVVEAVLRLRKNRIGESILEQQGTEGSRGSVDPIHPLPSPTQILLVGYSYGAMVTHQCLLEWVSQGGVDEPGIRLVDDLNDSGIRLVGEMDGTDIDVEDDDLCLTSSLSPIPLATILISYPISVSWALTMWHSPTIRLPPAFIPLLWVYGIRDQFTSPSSYTSWWNKALDAGSNGEEGMRSCVGIPEVDHFWLRAEGRLLGEIQGWIGTLNQSSILEGRDAVEWKSPSPL